MREEDTDAGSNTFELQASNVFALSELSTILSAFRQNSIPVLLLKGASLLETVYRETLARSIADLDLLVHPGDLGKADLAMSQCGYAQLSHNWGNHVTYRKGTSASIPVEIHWDLFNTRHPLQKYAFRINTKEFWNEIEPVPVGAETGHILSPENQIIYLCCHLLKESYGDEKWIKDIELVVRYYEDRINWQELISRAARYKVRKTVWWALSYVSRRCGTRLPDNLQESLGQVDPSRYEKDIMERLFHNKGTGRLRLLGVYLSAIETPLDKVRALLEVGPYMICRSAMMRRTFHFPEA